MIDLLPDFLIDYASSNNSNPTPENDLSNTMCLCSDRPEESFSEKQCEWIQPEIPSLPNKDNPFLFFDLGMTKETQDILNSLEWNSTYSAGWGYKEFTTAKHDFIRDTTPSIIDDKSITIDSKPFSNDYIDTAISLLANDLKEVLAPKSKHHADTVATTIVSMTQSLHEYFTEKCDSSQIPYLTAIYVSDYQIKKLGWHQDLHSPSEYRLTIGFNDNMSTIFAKHREWDRREVFNGYDHLIKNDEIMTPKLGQAALFLPEGEGAVHTVPMTQKTYRFFMLSTPCFFKYLIED